MVRRDMLGILGAGAAGLTVLAGTSASAQEPGEKKVQGHHIMDECARVCNETAAHCLQQAQASGAGAQGQAHHLMVHEATMDCQAFCQLTSALMARKSKMMAYAHQACADACRDCADVCDKANDEVTKRCAEICRRCEQHCRQHIKATAR